MGISHQLLIAIKSYVTMAIKASKVSSNMTNFLKGIATFLTFLFIVLITAMVAFNEVMFTIQNIGYFHNSTMSDGWLIPISVAAILGAFRLRNTIKKALS